MQACRCGGKTRGALPDGARPGLHSEPLDAAIRGCLRQFTPALGDYSFHIVPSATRATINSKMMMQHVLTLLAFSMAIAMWWYYTGAVDESLSRHQKWLPKMHPLSTAGAHIIILGS
jgi:hypothetical protein